MAMKLRVIELRAERKYDSLIVRAVSALFDFVSEYGTQPERSLAFSAIIMLYNGVLIGGSGKWTTSLNCAEDGKLGWLTQLCGEGFIPTVTVSVLFALQPLVDPLGALRGSFLLTPTSFVVSFWLWLSSLIVLILIGTSIFGIRRRIIDN
jgi:hypothetical protein